MQKIRIKAWHEGWWILKCKKAELKPPHACSHMLIEINPYSYLNTSTRLIKHHQATPSKTQWCLTTLLDKPLSSVLLRGEPQPGSVQTCGLPHVLHGLTAPCMVTHSCSSCSRAGIHNSRWSAVFAPLWTRCWCLQLSGKTWGPPWWPRPPPGTWAVWVEGWCPKAFWGSRRGTCAPRWGERTRRGGGVTSEIARGK